LRGQKKAPDEPALSESQRQKDTKAIRNGAPETAARSSLRCCLPYRVKPVNKGLNSPFRVYALVASVKSGLISAQQLINQLTFPACFTWRNKSGRALSLCFRRIYAAFHLSI
jgi:hypothetical protein